MRRRWVPVGAIALAALAAVVVIMARQPGTGVVRVMTLDQNPTALALDAGAGRAIVALNAGRPGAQNRLLILDSGTGTLARTVAVDDAPAALAVDDAAGYVYLAAGPNPDSDPNTMNTGTVSVVDERRGRLVWRMTLDVAAVAMALDRRSGHLLTVSRGGLVSGGAYGAGTLAIRDAMTARTLYTGAVGLYPTSVAVDTRTERVFVANLIANSVSVLDARNGRPLRAIPLGAPSMYNGRAAEVAVDERTGRVFVLSLPPTIAGDPKPARGGVAVIDSATGRLLRMIGLRNPAALAVDGHTGQVFVAADGGIDIMDGTSGRLLRTIATGISPTAIVVDGQRGRAVLIKGDSAARDADPWAWMPGWLRSRLPFIPAPPLRFHNVPASVSILDLTR